MGGTTLSAHLSERRPRFRPRRLGRRLLRHHLPLAALSLAGGLAVVVTLPPGADRLFQWSLSTAYVGLLWLALTLLLGPLNLLRQQPNPVSTDLRRDIGIWAGVVGLAHTVVGLLVHARGFLHQNFVVVDRNGDVSLRLDGFGIANDVGLFASLGLLLLLALSNDLSLRGLGPGRWKAIQRTNYAILAFVALHIILYQRLERRPSVYVVLLGVSLVLVVALQLAGAWSRLGRRRADSD